MAGAYYNEIDPKAGAWLDELARNDLIAPGTVDVRSIADVKPGELAGYTQCHFFAGIGGWSYALRAGGWPDDVRVWTGSCPCQPYSSAGRGLGDADPRNLWPQFRLLIAECRPPVVFGEQVASKAGRRWLAGVRADLETLGYAVGAVDLGAPCVGSPHIRQRLFWVADDGRGCSRIAESDRQQERPGQQASQRPDALGCGLSTGGMGHAERSERRSDVRGRLHESDRPDAGRPEAERSPSGTGSDACSAVDRLPSRADGMGHPVSAGWQGRGTGTRSQPGSGPGRGPLAATGAWSDFDIVLCRDGKARRIESGSFPLAHGVPFRVVRLRGYGNAIVPQVAAEFVAAFLEARGGLT